MVVKRCQETDSNLAEVFEIGVWNLASRPVVLDQVLVKLKVRLREFRKRAQILGSTGVGLQRPRWRRTGRILPARTGRGGLRPTRAHQHDSDHSNGCEAHGASPESLLRGRFATEHGDGFDLDQQIGTAENRLNTRGSWQWIQILLLVKSRALF